MGKSKRKAMHNRKEEQQAKNVLKTMGVIALILVFLMFIVYSAWA